MHKEHVLLELIIASSPKIILNLPSNRLKNVINKENNQAKETGLFMINGICKDFSLLSMEYPLPSKITSTWQEQAQLWESQSEFKESSKKIVLP